MLQFALLFCYRDGIVSRLMYCHHLDIGIKRLINFQLISLIFF